MFDTDYTITGKHATFLKYLAEKNSKDDGSSATSSAMVFERYIDVYMNAVVWGMLYNRTAERDNTSSDRARIYADALVREKDTCMLLYRLVMLLDKSVDLSSEERLNRAFRYDSQADKTEELKQNMEVFHAYMRGGLEELHEQFTDGCTSRLDYMDRIHEIMEDFMEELAGQSEEKLESLMR